MNAMHEEVADSLSPVCALDPLPTLPLSLPSVQYTWNRRGINFRVFQSQCACLMNTLTFYKDQSAYSSTAFIRV